MIVTLNVWVSINKRNEWIVLHAYLHCINVHINWTGYGELLWNSTTANKFVFFHKVRTAQQYLSASSTLLKERLIQNETTSFSFLVVKNPDFVFFVLIVLPDYKGVVCQCFKSVCIVCRSVLIGNPPASKSMTGWEQLDSNSFGTSLHNLPGICIALKNDPHKCLQRLAIGWRYPGIAEQSWAVHHCSQWQGPWFLYLLPWARRAWPMCQSPVASRWLAQFLEANFVFIGREAFHGINISSYA